MNRYDIYLNWVRGLLWGTLGAELIVAGLFIRETVDQYLESVASVPSGVLPLLSFAQVSMFLSLMAGVLLFMGMLVRFARH